MMLSRSVVWIAGITLLALSTISTAQAQTVTFSDINDAVPSRFFDAATSAPDPANPNRLIIGFNTGIDLKLWKVNGFAASTAAFYYPTAMDTISFRVEAPAGYYIAKLTYSQRGNGSVARSGKAGGGAHWVVDDNAVDLGLFGTSPTLSGTVDFTGQNRTSVSVSITNSLYAFAPPSLGTATITLTSADVLVELLPLAP